MKMAALMSYKLTRAKGRLRITTSTLVRREKLVIIEQLMPVEEKLLDLMTP
jgi:hypothetical protein